MDQGKLKTDKIGVYTVLDRQRVYKVNRKHIPHGARFVVEIQSMIGDAWEPWSYSENNTQALDDMALVPKEYDKCKRIRRIS